jgi:hypothetical protein
MDMNAIFVFRLAAPLAALALTGCVASATVGAPATPAPPPTPPPPQVIYVQPPAQPTPAEGLDMATSSLLILVVLSGCGVMAVTGFLIGRLMHSGAPAQSNTYSHDMGGMYRVEMTPAEYTEWAQLQAYKARQIAQANREVIHVRR